ncbi:hypothetical protein [Pseudoalteromonas luteoviolacea]|uniref:hypothetical protein n=1 Tax=Pseudoalteromonas luteoviolacea TaxID=43657 RepID=UPI001B35DA86|nr:hypothetical protein [Pseudoalteromonas luteoviolacea]MBQ4836810.1 hypothetical protein [Pseudoalteromonas luteoviolacea]
MKLKKRSLKHLSEKALNDVKGGGGGAGTTAEPPQKAANEVVNLPKEKVSG